MKRTLMRICAGLFAALNLGYYSALKIADPERFFDFSFVLVALAATALLPAFPESAPSRLIRKTFLGGRKRRVAVLSPAAAFLAVSAGILVWICIPPGNLAAPDRGYLLVLGGGLRGDGRVSPILASRLDAASEFAESRPELRLVLTGGHLKHTPWSEADEMERYLARIGAIQQERVLKEGASLDTIQNFAFSKKIILNDLCERSSLGEKSAGDDMAGNGAMPPVCVMTSGFHIKRALCLADAAGFGAITARSVPTPALYAPIAYLREIGAWWKLGIRKVALLAAGKTLF